MALYWETLSRWATRRSRRDALEAGVPLVFLQAVDECNSIDREAAQRLLNVPNSHNTGNIQGVLAAHVGMRVRFTVKVNARLGLVQEQRATIVDSVFLKKNTVHDTTAAMPESCSDRGFFLQECGFKWMIS